MKYYFFFYTIFENELIENLKKIITEYDLLTNCLSNGLWYFVSTLWAFSLSILDDEYFLFLLRFGENSLCKFYWLIALTDFLNSYIFCSFSLEKVSIVIIVIALFAWFEYW